MIGASGNCLAQLCASLNLVISSRLDDALGNILLNVVEFQEDAFTYGWLLVITVDVFVIDCSNLSPIPGIWSLNMIETLSGRFAAISALRILAVAVFCCPVVSYATPPNYVSFDRTQRIDITTDDRDILRVWVIFVGQGDSLLIQLPKRHYESTGTDWFTGDPIDSTMDVLVDTGSFRGPNSHRSSAFLETIYPGARVIEHLVISHHDSDHVKGMTHLLGDDSVQVNHIYHNGLASYRPNRNLTSSLTTPAGTSCPNRGVCTVKRQRMSRTMGFLRSSGNSFRVGYLIDSLGELRTRFNSGHFQGVYANLARAVVQKSEPQGVMSFNRVHDGDEIDIGGGPVSLKFMWPRKIPRQYGGRNWGETINGNSVTMKLEYGEFQMLFTGDHNEHSEEDLIDYLDSSTPDRLDELETDVLKVPHHGSSHGLEAFFKHAKLDPVLGVASMGEQGFRSNWKHPPRTSSSGWADRIVFTVP